MGWLGFDPLFWLHHANVDRLLQLWSSLHPEVWVSKGDADIDGSVSIPANSLVDENTGSSLCFSIPTMVLRPLTHTFPVAHNL